VVKQGDWARNIAAQFSYGACFPHLSGSFTHHKSMTWGQLLYFSSEGCCAKDLHCP
jgi:hypothetical protein